MDRQLYKQSFNPQDPPDWLCPVCAKSLLKIKPGTFHFEETRESVAAHEHDAWEPDWIIYRFSCLLQCSNSKCKEVTTCAGRGGVGIDVMFGSEGEPDQYYADFFKARFFEPALNIIPIPPHCPASIVRPLRLSFAAFPNDPAAALNHLRASAEEILTNIGVKRFTIKKNKKHLLSLHARIHLLPSKYAAVQSLLLAIKWLGNAGSHPGVNVSMDDAMDSYELMEEVLQSLYAQNSSKAKKIAAKVNKKKGPTSKHP